MFYTNTSAIQDIADKYKAYKAYNMLAQHFVLHVTGIAYFIFNLKEYL